MEKLKQRQEAPREPEGAGDYWEVQTDYGTWHVNGETAARIGRMLDRRWRPRWVKFVDLNGSRTWIRTDLIESISESTERQRVQERTFSYLTRKEYRSDRRWDDDLD